jgi:hypothetical protein
VLLVLVALFFMTRRKRGNPLLLFSKLQEPLLGEPGQQGVEMAQIADSQDMVNNKGLPLPMHYEYAGATSSTTATTAPHILSSHADTSVAPAFDQGTCFPLNDAAKVQVAQFWQGLVTDNASRIAVQLPYAVLDSATNNFDSSMCIGGGGSCLVYKCEVFGVQVAVRALKALMRESESESASVNADGSDAREMAARQAKAKAKAKVHGLEERQFLTYAVSWVCLLMGSRDAWCWRCARAALYTMCWRRMPGR